MHNYLAVNVINCCHTQLSIEPNQLNVFILCDQELMIFGRHGRPQREPAHEDLEDIMGTYRAMAFAMREQAAATNRMMERLDRQREEGHGGNLDGVEVDLEYLKFPKFRKANPPSFRRTFNLDKAEEWIKAMEKIFSILVYVLRTEGGICYLHVGGGYRVLLD